ncbi:response regulator [Spirosoma aerophilum]
MVPGPAIWVVDDDTDDQFLLEIAFKGLNPPILVKQLYDGDQLLPELEAAPVLPQLVLLDLNMSRKNGFDTLRELRGLPKYKELPIIVLTTSSLTRDKEESYRLGADGFLTKPLTNDDTVSMLKLLAMEWLEN